MAFLKDNKLFSQNIFSRDSQPLPSSSANIHQVMLIFIMYVWKMFIAVSLSSDVTLRFAFLE
jgi:hypothetical protein